MIRTVEMREQRHKLHVDARTIIDKADDEKRSLSAEEKASYDKIIKQADELRTQIEDAERKNDLEAREIIDRDSKTDEKRTETKKVETREIGPRGTDEYRSAFAKFLSTKNYTPEEQRALEAGTGSKGGYLYASEQFVNELIQAVTDATIFRQMARVWPPIGQADSLGAPVLSSRMAAAEWTSELGTPSTDSTLAFGRRNITPHPLAKEIKVSKTLLRKTSAAESIVRSELARVSAEAQENAFMTGNGVQKPLGIFTASNFGISTDRDVSTGNTSTSVTFDGLKAAKYTLKQAYWGGAAWIAHREFMEQVAKLKDGNGRYLLQDSVVQGEPDRLLGFPVRLSEYCSHVFTTGLYVAVLGNFSNYWIADSESVEIQRAEELYIRENQDLFVMRSGCDGAPVLEEAFVRVTLG